jgi:hypothetical protein
LKKMFKVLHTATFHDLNVKIQEQLQLGRYPYGNPFELNNERCQVVYVAPSPVANAVSYAISDEGRITTLDWKDVSLETVLCLQGLFPV